jgi:hypothetical protein
MFKVENDPWDDVFFSWKAAARRSDYLQKTLLKPCRVRILAAL